MAEFDVPKEIMESQLALLRKISKTGKVKVGINEVTKAIEREKAKFVLIATDVNPKEIVMHLPMLCVEKKVPYSFVESKEELGKSAGLNESTASVAVTDEGRDGKKDLLDLVKKLEEIKK